MIIERRHNILSQNLFLFGSGIGVDARGPSRHMNFVVGIQSAKLRTPVELVLHRNPTSDNRLKVLFSKSFKIVSVLQCLPHAKVTSAKLSIVA